MKRIPLSGNRIDWWNPTSAYASLPGRTVYLPPTAAIGIDPACSSPNVYAGLSFDRLDSPIYLRPGEYVRLPNPVRMVYIFNPIIRQLSKDGATMVGPAAYPPYSLVSLAVSESYADFEAWRSNRTRPLPTAAIIAVAPLTATDPQAADAPDGLVVPCSGMEKIRLRLFPRNAAGGVISPPADLAGTVRLAKRLRIPENGTPAFDKSAFNVQVVDDGALSAIAYWAGWNVDAAQDWAFNQTQTINEYDVGPADLVNFQVTGLAGAGVTDVLAIVEGQ